MKEHSFLKISLFTFTVIAFLCVGDASVTAKEPRYDAIRSESDKAVVFLSRSKGAPQSSENALELSSPTAPRQSDLLRPVSDRELRNLSTRE
ncbi:MAG TPA: hypothetical protein PKC98_23450, partial [Candidatus Melainabacteria bacterium]|nr:hypothetical protein [Candidatus Melainabacteria bacterium]